MPTPAELIDRYRIAALAVAVSAGVHATVLLGLPPRIESIDDRPGIVYSASLDPAATVVSASAPSPAPAPRRVGKPRPKPRPAPPPEVEAPPTVQAPEVIPEPAPPPAAVEEPKPEVVAMAQPAVPVPPPEPPKFPVESFPENVSISYTLTSTFADGRAEYTWSRDGDEYKITGEAEAVGFFTLFLEGRILQESRGTVTAEGLRPKRFRENKPNTPPEGLEFDWPARKVTFEAKGEAKTTELADNTVDWLSMIFHLAHVPPSGEDYTLKVFTQRKMYQFTLKVLGIEEIEIPLGKVKALHLRHIDPKDNDVVDVWLGVEHHYLPVKLRYPVARNRLVVEQSATSVKAR